MRLEIREPDGARQTVELEPRLTIVGRDPSCDVVIRDPKCSRRHAVFEGTAAGLLVRDSGSANGLFVNGERVDRTLLRPGDEIRVGRVTLTLLPDASGPPPSDPGADASGSGAHDEAPTLLDDRRLVASCLAHPGAPGARSLPITTLATLWLLAGPLSLLAAGGLAIHSEGASAVVGVLLLGGVLLTLLGSALSFGLLAGARWARTLHLVLCVPLALTCIFAPFALVAATYLLGARTRARFESRDAIPPSATAADQEGPERAFALALAAAAFLSLLLTISGTIVWRASRASGPEGALAASGPVLNRMRAMRSAQESFRRVCNLGYGDLEGLSNPSSVLPGYRPGAPPFLSSDDASLEAHGYRFRLAVGGPMSPTPDCATLRRFRVFEYTAVPLSGGGPHLLLGPDGAIRAADGRPARKEDPSVEHER